MSATEERGSSLRQKALRALDRSPHEPYTGATTTDLTPDPEALRMVRRVLAALGRRAGESDLVMLAELVALRADLDQAIADAVTGLRNDPDLPASWTDIGQALGITRQSAQQRFGAGNGLRRPGGQPGNWR